MQVDEIGVSGELLEAALHHWQSLCGENRSLPRPADLDPVTIPRQVLPNSELVEVLSDPLDFRYRLIGTAIYSISHSSYSGLKLSEIPTQAPPSRMFDFFALACRRAAPLCARLPYIGPDSFVESIRNLLLPFGEDADKVSLFWSVVEIGRRNPGQA
jgi:hypothetical protein